MRVTAVQTFQHPDDPQRNLDEACEQVGRVIGREHPDLVVVPEGFADYFPLNVEGKGEPLDGQTRNRMQALAAEGNCHIAFGMLRREPEGLYNSIILLNGQGVVGVYDKTHLWYSPAKPHHFEWKYLLPGKRLGLFDTDLGRLGIMICYDGSFPEVPRSLALQGAEMICWCMNNGNVLPTGYTHARLSMLPIAVANTFDPERGYGGTGILDGDGTLLAETPGDQPAEVTVELDLQHWKELRASGEAVKGFLRGRRPDLYIGLTEPYPEAKPFT